MRQQCPVCDSDKATIVMLPSTREGHDARPHRAFRCMTCDAQWADEEQWQRLKESAAQPPEPAPGPLTTG